MLLLLLFAFIAVPAAEIYVMVQVAEAIGAQWTVLLLLAGSAAGVALVRAQGRVAWRRLNAALAEGRVPGREVLDGALVLIGGALLIAPGFISDALGLLLLAPPSRALARRALTRRFVGRFWGTRLRRRRPPPPRGYDVEGTAVEVERERLP